MSLLHPQPFPFDFDDWKQQPFAERTRLLCQAWVVEGFGVPPAVYVFYLLKTLFYIRAWTWFASFSTEPGSLREIGTTFSESTTKPYWG